VQVCDEAHILKNVKSGCTTALQGARTSMRVALTGSPLQNNLKEYYCMVNFVREGFLGSMGDFRNRFVNPICNGQMEDSTKQDVRTMKQRAHVLHKKLEGFVQRKGVAVLRRQVRAQ
jgi:transcriptional regulator ATRX